MTISKLKTKEKMSVRGSTESLCACDQRGYGFGMTDDRWGPVQYAEDEQMDDHNVLPYSG